MTLDTTTHCPDWQLTIRRAQAEIFESEAEQRRLQEATEAQEQREQDAKDASALKRALAHFDIPAEPTRNEWVLDTFRFFLDCPYDVQKAYWKDAEKRQHFGGWPKPDASPDDLMDVVSFTLAVEHVDGDLVQGFNDRYLRQSIEVNHKQPDSDWTNFRAALADALDMIEAEFLEASERKANWETRKQQPAQDVEPAQEPSLAEQLEALVRRIAREEIHRQYEF